MSHNNQWDLLLDLQFESPSNYGLCSERVYYVTNQFNDKLTIKTPSSVNIFNNSFIFRFLNYIYAIII